MQSRSIAVNVYQRCGVVNLHDMCMQINLQHVFKMSAIIWAVHAAGQWMFWWCIGPCCAKCLSERLQTEY